MKSDLNTTAAGVVAEATGQRPRREPGNVFVESGRIGGERRAAKMTSEQRRDSARKALDARWAKAREAKQAAG